MISQLTSLTQWVPTAISLISIGVGVWIADRAIRKSRELAEWSFRAASEKDHKRWIRDQRKVEWSELLKAAGQIRRVMPPGLMNSLERAKLIRANLKPALQEFEVVAAGCAFLNDFF
jgi:hypothetical protein